MFDVAARRSLSDQLYMEFKRRIRAGELSPNERLPTEERLTGEFQVSRTVVREAMARLSADGLVKARHGAGVYVTDTAHYEAFQITRDELGTYEDVMQLLELRLATETEMAGLAAARRTKKDIDELRRLLAAVGSNSEHPDAAVDADAALHMAIARTAKNLYFERFISFLGIRLIPNRNLVMRGLDGDRLQQWLETLHQEHTAIVDAIAAGDQQGAREAARQHLANSLARHAQLANQEDATTTS